jgi:hypothetical protein
MYSSIPLSEAIGVVHPESSSTRAGILFLPQNEINIMILFLLPQLGSGGAWFDYLWFNESMDGKVFHFNGVLMVNCLSTQLGPQWVLRMLYLAVI